MPASPPSPTQTAIPGRCKNAVTRLHDPSHFKRLGSSEDVNGCKGRLIELEAGLFESHCPMDPRPRSTALHGDKMTGTSHPTEAHLGAGMQQPGSQSHGSRS